MVDVNFVKNSHMIFIEGALIYEHHFMYFSSSLEHLQIITCNAM
jgi:hypothetical protein